MAGWRLHGSLQGKDRRYLKLPGMAELMLFRAFFLVQAYLAWYNETEIGLKQLCEQRGIVWADRGNDRSLIRHR